MRGAESSRIAERRISARLTGDADYVEKRSQLLKAAGKIFREKGYDKASISDFAREIGIDRASIYYYTSGKEELFRDLVHETVSENVAMVEGVLASEAAPAAKIRALIVNLMISYERHFPYLYVYIQEDMARIASARTEWAQEMKQLSERFDAAFLGIIEDGIEAGVLAADGRSAQVVAFGIIGMCNWSHRWYRPSGRRPAAAIGECFADMVLKGLERKLDGAS